MSHNNQEQRPHQPDTIYFPEIMYPQKDPQYKILNTALCQSQLCTQYLVPPSIIAVICGFSLGKFVACSSTDCEEQIDLFNQWQYIDHVDGLRLGFLQYMNVQYCLNCYNKNKFVICKYINARFLCPGELYIYSNEGDEFTELCLEIMPRDVATMKKCASHMICCRQYFQCGNKCVDKLLPACAVCKEIICGDCISEDLYSPCLHCTKKICASCGSSQICVKCLDDLSH